MFQTKPLPYEQIVLRPEKTAMSKDAAAASPEKNWIEKYIFPILGIAATVTSAAVCGAFVWVHADIVELRSDVKDVSKHVEETKDTIASKSDAIIKSVNDLHEGLAVLVQRINDSQARARQGNVPEPAPADGPSGPH